MSSQYDLDDISIGYVDCTAARGIIAPLLQQDAIDKKTASNIYVALRGWTWKAMNYRRRDKELRQWYDLMRSVAAVLSKDHFAVSEQVSVLYAMLYESISVSEVFEDDGRKFLKSRPHGRKVLLAIADHDGPIGREDLHATIGMPVNTDSMLRILLTCSLVDRVESNGTPAFVLSRIGGEVVALLRTADAVAAEETEA